MIRSSMFAVLAVCGAAAAVAQEGPVGAPAEVEAGAAVDAAAAAPSAEAVTATELSEADIQAAIDAFNKSLSRRTGDIEIAKAHVHLSVPDGFYYLDPNDAKRVLEEAWSNPPGDLTEGMLFPAGMSPTDENAWGVVITFEETGYVSDKDAAKIDYKDLLADLTRGQELANAERRELNFPAMHLVGWASPPRYDAAAHKLYWAKEISVEGEDMHVLNYDMRVLGRRGVLSLNFVADVDDLTAVEQASPTVLKMANFDEGFRYADYNPKTDAKADFGIAGLIAGGALGAAVAKKAGLLGILLLVLKKAWFVVAAGIAGVGGWLRRMFGGGKTTA